MSDSHVRPKKFWKEKTHPELISRRSRYRRSIDSLLASAVSCNESLSHRPNCRLLARYLLERAWNNERERIVSSISVYDERSAMIQATHLRTPRIRGDNANRNKHLAARDRHVSARIYYIPNTHTLDERLKGCTRPRNHDRDNDEHAAGPFLLPTSADESHRYLGYSSFKPT